MLHIRAHVQLLSIVINFPCSRERHSLDQWISVCWEWICHRVVRSLVNSDDQLRKRIWTTMQDFTVLADATRMVASHGQYHTEVCTSLSVATIWQLSLKFERCLDLTRWGGEHWWDQRDLYLSVSQFVCWYDAVSDDIHVPVCACTLTIRYNLSGGKSIRYVYVWSSVCTVDIRTEETSSCQQWWSTEEENRAIHYPYGSITWWSVPAHSWCVKPRVRCYDFTQLSMKFERCLDSEGEVVGHWSTICIWV